MQLVLSLGVIPNTGIAVRDRLIFGNVFNLIGLDRAENKRSTTLGTIKISPFVFDAATGNRVAIDKIVSLALTNDPDFSSDFTIEAGPWLNHNYRLDRDYRRTIDPVYFDDNTQDLFIGGPVDGEETNADSDGSFYVENWRFSPKYGFCKVFVQVTVEVNGTQLSISDRLSLYDSKIVLGSLPTPPSILQHTNLNTISPKFTIQKGASLSNIEEIFDVPTYTWIEQRVAARKSSPAFTNRLVYKDLTGSSSSLVIYDNVDDIPTNVVGSNPASTLLADQFACLANAIVTTTHATDTVGVASFSFDPAMYSSDQSLLIGIGDNTSINLATIVGCRIDISRANGCSARSYFVTDNVDFIGAGPDPEAVYGESIALPDEVALMLAGPCALECILSERLNRCHLEIILTSQGKQPLKIFSDVVEYSLLAGYNRLMVLGFIGEGDIQIQEIIQFGGRCVSEASYTSLDSDVDVRRSIWHSGTWETVVDDSHSTGYSFDNLNIIIGNEIFDSNVMFEPRTYTTNVLFDMKFDHFDVFDIILNQSEINNTNDNVNAIRLSFNERKLVVYTLNQSPILVFDNLTSLDALQISLEIDKDNADSLLLNLADKDRGWIKTVPLYFEIDPNFIGWSMEIQAPRGHEVAVSSLKCTALPEDRNAIIRSRPSISGRGFVGQHCLGLTCAPRNKVGSIDNAESTYFHFITNEIIDTDNPPSLIMGQSLQTDDLILTVSHNQASILTYKDGRLFTASADSHIQVGGSQYVHAFQNGSGTSLDPSTEILTGLSGTIEGHVLAIGNYVLVVSGTASKTGLYQVTSIGPVIAKRVYADQLSRTIKRGFYLSVQRTSSNESYWIASYNKGVDKQIVLIDNAWTSLLDTSWTYSNNFYHPNFVLVPVDIRSSAIDTQTRIVRAIDLFANNNEDLSVLDARLFSGSHNSIDAPLNTWMSAYFTKSDGVVRPNGLCQIPCTLGQLVSIATDDVLWVMIKCVKNSCEILGLNDESSVENTVKFSSTFIKSPYQPVSLAVYADYQSQGYIAYNHTLASFRCRTLNDSRLPSMYSNELITFETAGINKPLYSSTELGFRLLSRSLDGRLGFIVGSIYPIKAARLHAYGERSPYFSTSWSNWKDAAYWKDLEPCLARWDTSASLTGVPGNVDGITSLQSGDRVLVSHTNPLLNGIYAVAAGTWSRTTDLSVPDDIQSFIRVLVTGGTVYGGKRFYATVENITNEEPYFSIGVSRLIWHEWSTSTSNQWSYFTIDVGAYNANDGDLGSRDDLLRRHYRYFGLRYIQCETLGSSDRSNITNRIATNVECRAIKDTLPPILYVAHLPTDDALPGYTNTLKTRFRLANNGDITAIKEIRYKDSQGNWSPWIPYSDLLLINLTDGEDEGRIIEFQARDYGNNVTTADYGWLRVSPPANLLLHCACQWQNSQGNTILFGGTRCIDGTNLTCELYDLSYVKSGLAFRLIDNNGIPITLSVVDEVRIYVDGSELSRYYESPGGSAYALGAPGNSFAIDPTTGAVLICQNISDSAIVTADIRKRALVIVEWDGTNLKDTVYNPLSSERVCTSLARVKNSVIYGTNNGHILQFDSSGEIQIIANINESVNALLYREDATIGWLIAAGGAGSIWHGYVSQQILSGGLQPLVAQGQTTSTFRTGYIDSDVIALSGDYNELVLINGSFDNPRTSIVALPEVITLSGENKKLSASSISRFENRLFVATNHQPLIYDIQLELGVPTLTINSSLTASEICLPTQAEHQYAVQNNPIRYWSDTHTAGNSIGDQFQLISLENHANNIDNAAMLIGHANIGTSFIELGDSHRFLETLRNTSYSLHCELMVQGPGTQTIDIDDGYVNYNLKVSSDVLTLSSGNRTISTPDVLSSSSFGTRKLWSFSSASSMEDKDPYHVGDSTATSDSLAGWSAVKFVIPQTEMQLVGTVENYTESETTTRPIASKFLRLYCLDAGDPEILWHGATFNIFHNDSITVRARANTPNKLLQIALTSNQYEVPHWITIGTLTDEFKIFDHVITGNTQINNVQLRIVDMSKNSDEEKLSIFSDNTADYHVDIDYIKLGYIPYAVKLDEDFCSIYISVNNETITVYQQNQTQPLLMLSGKLGKSLGRKRIRLGRMQDDVDDSIMFITKLDRCDVLYDADFDAKINALGSVHRLSTGPVRILMSYNGALLALADGATANANIPPENRIAQKAEWHRTRERWIVNNHQPSFDRSINSPTTAAVLNNELFVIGVKT